MSNLKLRNTLKSYTMIFMIGILVGCICRLLDFFPADTLWSFSSIQTLVGFWIITNTIIVLLSTSNICAGISSFLYMFGMTFSFYALQAMLGMFIPLFFGGFRIALFVLFTVLSILLQVRDVHFRIFLKILPEIWEKKFDGSLWGSMVEFITVGRNKEITVSFRDGTEIQA